MTLNVSKTCPQDEEALETNNKGLLQYRVVQGSRPPPPPLPFS